MVLSNPESSKEKATINSLDSGLGHTLSFGNLETQTCGSWSMLLVGTQNEIAKAGAKTAEDFTAQQALSFQGQSQFLQGSLNAARRSAESQKKQMELEAASNFTAAGMTVGMGVLPMAHKTFMDSDKPYLRRLNSKTLGRLNNAQDKLSQQEKLLEMAQKSAKATTGKVKLTPGQTKATTAEQEIVIKRRDELLNTGGGQARELSNTPTTITDPNTKQTTTATEETAFRQKGYNPKTQKYEFNRRKGQYYRKRVDATKDPKEAEYQDKLANDNRRTIGAYHFDKLDEEAIASMDATQKKEFIAKLESNIRATKTEINTETVNMQMFQQTMIQALDAVKNGTQGTFQMYQAPCAAEVKKAEAESTIGNQEAGVAGGVTQSIASAKASILDSVEKMLQGFSGAFQGMHG